MPYDQDLLDEIMGDGLAYGGPAFVEQVTLDATRVADAIVPWDGGGDEPPERRSAWLPPPRSSSTPAAPSWSARWCPPPGGGARVVAPARCPDGHPLRPGRVLLGWSPCRCGGHKWWECVELLADGRECRGTVLAPEPDEGCRFVGIGSGDAVAPRARR